MSGSQPAGGRVIPEGGSEEHLVQICPKTDDCPNGIFPQSHIFFHNNSLNCDFAFGNGYFCNDYHTLVRNILMEIMANIGEI